ncbi:telomeric repeat-binding factor 2-interacting protein 1 isoform X2 [Microcaecilia unicolor]|uniref:Telomeric repeat-binding factor 2-interacting protein 1 n=1 Tax=Microcaecilia unicolor TaxID=1415580 RepID=A0A6P7Y3V0_9AMPH|nr:telomeric repeat-binding factor 2-interacting protein 1 isoform X2 [Microcaecilia unicolor]
MMAASFSHSRTLFLNENGSPLRFYLRPSTAKLQLYPLILHGGGVMCRTQEPDAVLLWDPGESLPLGAARETEATGCTYISTRYITDCVERNEKLDLCAYRLQEEARVAGSVSSSCTRELPSFRRSGRTTFSQAEDMTILRYLRDHAAPESACSGNAIWKKMEQLQLTGHSWQAMRDRYLKQLWHREQSYQVLNTHSSQFPQQPKNKKEIQTGTCPLQPKMETSLQGTTSIHLPAAQPSQEDTCITEELPDKVAEFHQKKGAKMLEENKLNGDQGLKVQKKAAEKPPAEEGILHIFEIANQEFEVEYETIAETLPHGKDTEKEVSPEPQPMKETDGPKSVTTEDSAVTDPHPPARAPETEVETLKRCIQGLMEEFGFSLSVITQAFLKNSGELEATRYFLKNRKRADGYPIWTCQDDVLLEEKDTKVRKKLIKKYGAENVVKRCKFLNS